MNKNLLIHPGEILNEEFLIPLEITQYRLAKEINVSPRRINEIIHGDRSITLDTALRLGRFFNMTPQFWLNLQNSHDVDVARMGLAKKIEREVRVFEPA